PLESNELAHRVAETFEPMALDKQILFRVIKAPDLPATIESDTQRLSQILKNLLSNALKFTDRGTVSFEMRPLPDGNIEFAVRDTGIGIAPAHTHLMFEPILH